VDILWASSGRVYKVSAADDTTVDEVLETLDYLRRKIAALEQRVHRLEVDGDFIDADPEDEWD
jgi:hypothetical protein